MKTEQSKEYVFMCEFVNSSLHCILCVTTKRVALRGGLAGRPLPRVRTEMLRRYGATVQALRSEALCQCAQPATEFEAKDRELRNLPRREGDRCHGCHAVVDVSPGCHQRSPATSQRDHVEGSSGSEEGCCSSTTQRVGATSPALQIQAARNMCVRGAQFPLAALHQAVSCFQTGAKEAQH